MAKIVRCPFGCPLEHQESTASEALSWFWADHRLFCPNFDEYLRNAEKGSLKEEKYSFRTIETRQKEDM